MSVIRAFIAIDFPPEILQRLEQVTNQLKQAMGDVPVRWVPVDNIHLTLKFLGDVSVANLEMLKKIMQTVISQYSEFEISVGGLGAFPKKHHPRVIWIGLEVPSDLLTMQHALDIETARLGYASEERPFTPHLTFGRVSRNVTDRDLHLIADAIISHPVGFLGAACIQEVHLYQSDLRPSGAVYSRLFSVPLGTETLA